MINVLSFSFVKPTDYSKSRSQILWLLFFKITYFLKKIIHPSSKRPFLNKHLLFCIKWNTKNYQALRFNTLNWPAGVHIGIHSNQKLSIGDISEVYFVLITSVLIINKPWEQKQRRQQICNSRSLQWWKHTRNKSSTDKATTICHIHARGNTTSYQI